MAVPTIHVDVVSAEEQIYSGEAEFVVLPGMMGELGIYPRHTPLFTQIKPGSVRIKPANAQTEELVFVQGGFLEVQPDLVTVLADTAIRAKDLDEKAALEAKRAAEEAMLNKTSNHGVAVGARLYGTAQRQTPCLPQLSYGARSYGGGPLSATAPVGERPTNAVADSGRPPYHPAP